MNLPQTEDFWKQTLPKLRGLPAYERDIKPLILQKTVDGVAHFHCQPVSLDWLENRLKQQILDAIPDECGVVDVAFEVAQSAHTPNASFVDLESNAPDMAVTGAYHHKHNAIIQPDKKEYNQATQYYRKRWRPLLGPLLSELVRELRQRCNYQDGRNTFGVTYKQLADTLGVSERTVKRVLARNKDGSFKKQYLEYFIAATKMVKIVDGQGRFRNVKTTFVVYLDDALTPGDQAQLDAS